LDVPEAFVVAPQQQHNPLQPGNARDAKVKRYNATVATLTEKTSSQPHQPSGESYHNSTIETCLSDVISSAREEVDFSYVHPIDAQVVAANVVERIKDRMFSAGEDIDINYAQPVDAEVVGLTATDKVKAARARRYKLPDQSDNANTQGRISQNKYPAHPPSRSVGISAAAAAPSLSTYLVHGT
jgi:hypothetical protein